MATNKKRKNRGKGAGARERKRRADQYNAHVREKLRGNDLTYGYADMHLALMPSLLRSAKAVR